jgi:hypothetical protein
MFRLFYSTQISMTAKEVGALPLLTEANAFWCCRGFPTGVLLGNGPSFWIFTSLGCSYARRGIRQMPWPRGIPELMDERIVCFDAQYHAVDAGLWPQTM